ncbi:MAG: hypothetical protein DRH33_00250 [Candidatus Nealsonbacteria bacterium]|nr:MAG: hypothetical protein DRH33_00250 [Candidatus Nealsonbacteria bacterium]
MKLKFLKGLLIGYILLVPVIVSGITIEPPISATSIPALVDRITNWTFYIGIILAPLMILVGAFYFMTAAGDPNRVETGKKIIFWTIVGLAIILLSRMIIGIIRSILGS